MYKIFLAFILIFALGVPGAYAQIYKVQSTDTATPTISTVPAGTGVSTTTMDSDDDGLTDGSEVEPVGVEEPDFGIVGGDDTPTTTGIEHEDIGITGGGDDDDDEEEESNQYNESDFDFVSRLIELGVAFVKFDDIKGESDEGASDGDPDRPVVTGSVSNSGEGGSGVVIKGKKILENDEIPALLENAPDAEDVDTEIELVLYGARVARDNAGFNEIRMNDSQVSIDYRHGLKLLGFINTTIPATVTITFGDGERGATTDELGRVKVQFPWWHVFGRKTVRPSDILSAYDKAARGHANFGRVLLDSDANERNAITLQILGGVLGNVHDPGVTLLEL